MEGKVNNIYFDNYGEFEIVSGTCKHSFPIHVHESLCIITITKGSALLFHDNKFEILGESNQCIIPPYSTHAINPVNGEEYSYLTVCIKKDLLNMQISSVYISYVKSFIENSDTYSFNIQDIAECVHLSKYYFIRKFKEEVGITPYQFILNEKIKKIRQGILSNQTLSDLALELDFSDQSHLCNTFKKYMGISPLHFKSAYKVH